MPLLQAERLASLIAELGEAASEIGFASTEATNKRNRKQRVIEEADRRIVVEKRDEGSCNGSWVSMISEQNQKTWVLSQGTCICPIMV